MGSIPPFYCDQYSSVEAPPPPTAGASVGTGGGSQFWEEETNLTPDFGVVQYYYSNSNCDNETTWFPQQQEMLASLPQLNNMIDPSICASTACIHHHHHHNNNNNAAAAASVNGGCETQNFCHLGSCLPDHDQFYEFIPDDCFGLVPEIKPLYHSLPPHNWENQSNQVPVAAEESNMKVGRYSEEVRKERILRYLKKRNQRNFNKTIKYACRKTLADRRIRVRGRFARNNEASDQELNPTTNNNDTSIHKDTELLYNNNHDFGVQMKRDDEEWLQEITSLMYLPYIGS